MLLYEHMNKIPISPKTVLAFDLHGVIFNLCPIKVTKHLLKCPEKLRLFSIIFYPRLFLKSWQELRKGAIAEELLYKLAKDFPQFEKLLPTGFNVINSQKPVWPMVDLLRELKSKGYELHVLSNIGQNSVQMMQDLFPDIFCYFDKIMASTADDNYIKKPDIKAYQKYLKIFGLDPKDVIFIDDRLKNIKAAQMADISSILFKNPKKLKIKLIEINIL